MKYYTVVNEVEALQIAYAVCVCVCVCVRVCFVVWVGVCLSGGAAAMMPPSRSEVFQGRMSICTSGRKRQKGETSVEQNEIREDECETRNRKQKDGEKETKNSMWAAETNALELNFLCRHWFYASLLMAVHRAPRAEC